MSPTPYYSDATTTLYLGDMRDVLPALDIEPDCIVTDPPYGETSLAWDRWPEGWTALVADVASSMWCFGSMRMFLDRWDEFSDWRLSQDLVWEKNKGSSFVTDRFMRVHEHATHWYRGRWQDVFHVTPRVRNDGPNQSRRNKGGEQVGTHGHRHARPYVDDGTRLVRSVIRAPAANNRALHRTQKPAELLRPLIEYACPPGGLVLDVFAGSCSTGDAARQLGRRSVLIEADEATAEKGARRLSQDVLPLAVTP